MNNHNKLNYSVRWLCSCFLLSFFSQFNTAVAAGADAYPFTIEALHERHQDEITALHTYEAYAEQARADGYPNIAHLFRSLAASEGVHANNFKNLLEALGEKSRAKVLTDIKVLDTRQNLKNAVEVEAQEIDHEYPAILKKISPENHKRAMQYIDYAWKSEKQHRELITKMQKGTKKFWFSFLVDAIEGDPVDYHVCQICGSTLTELPKNQCAICEHPVSNYTLMKRVDPLEIKPDILDDF